MARGAQGACPAELRSEPGALVPTQQPPASEQGSRNRELSSPPRKRLPFQPLLEATCSLGKEKGWVLGSQPTHSWRLTHLFPGCWGGHGWALSSQLLTPIPDSMRKQEVWTGGEAGQGHGTGSPAEQVKALVDLLAGKGGQGPQALQTPNRTSESPLGTQNKGRQMEGYPWALSALLFPAHPPPCQHSPLASVCRLEDTEAP